MEQKKITNFLHKTGPEDIARFTTKKWVEIFDFFNSTYNCILKINNQLIEDADDLDIVALMYNLLYYSKIFRKTTGLFWNYYPDMPSSRYYDSYSDPDAAAIILRKKIFYSIKDSESFGYITKLVVSLGNSLPVVNYLVKAEKESKIVVPLKNMSNFMFNLVF